jgi:hypothetical protein
MLKEDAYKLLDLVETTTPKRKLRGEPKLWIEHIDESNSFRWNNCTLDVQSKVAYNMFTRLLSIVSQRIRDYGCVNSTLIACLVCIEGEDFNESIGNIDKFYCNEHYSILLEDGSHLIKVNGLSELVEHLDDLKEDRTLVRDMIKMTNVRLRRLLGELQC